MIEYYRRETMRSFSRQVNNMVGNHLMTTIFDEDENNRLAAQSRQMMQQSRQQEGFFGMIKDAWGVKEGSVVYPKEGGMMVTPDRRQSADPFR